ncbi:MAG: hypothetical protein WCV70_00890 [Patescibacteria group bacterium]|jgi:hypothetical protein
MRISANTDLGGAKVAFVAAATGSKVGGNFGLVMEAMGKIARENKGTKAVMIDPDKALCKLRKLNGTPPTGQKFLEVTDGGNINEISIS